MSTARDQLARMLALVPYLQHREAVPLDQVARDLGVPAEQVVRDLNVLWFCGLPGLGMGDLIEVDMDALDGEGVVRISNADYLSRPLRLRADEASALLVALQTLRATAPADQRETVDSVIAKLAAAAEDGAAHASQVAVQVADGGAEERLRDQLEHAVAARRQVRIAYLVPSRDEVTDRVVDPFAVVRHDGQHYLRAWCHLAGGERRFRLDRIQKATVLDTPVNVPTDTAPVALDEQIFSPGPDAVPARLRLATPARWVVDYVPHDEVVEVGDDLEVALRVADVRWLERLVLRCAPHATVLEPAEVGVRVRATAAATLELYATG
ncbi:proteasome accessory factor C [Nocardioides massiliensis]|uniref:Proteasome accessory factor C n=1 Tax=Nocardioides massiliensis TaxID=1325935 RepID=A0ABT9NRG4_9ACTN|nr:WYL domain-containing protein [Nocardioides massiliensis]MDP9823017.1 proteasome accessory factor C [Nocardioides massiliensis]